MAELTRRQREVYDTIVRLKAELGRRPTLLEIGNAIGMWQGTVHGRVKILIRKGWLDSDRNPVGAVCPSCGRAYA